MHKYRIPIIHTEQKTIIYSEGKQAFAEGQHRGYNPYTAHNLALAAIWWNGWDTAEEESRAAPPSKKQP